MGQTNPAIHIPCLILSLLWNEDEFEHEFEPYSEAEDLSSHKLKIS